jgi:hypothetical protein
VSAGPQRRVSLTVTLSVSLGALVVIVATLVLFIGLWSARKNTMELLSDRAEVGMSSALAQIDQHLRPAMEQASFVAEMIAAGEVAPEDEAALRSFLVASLAGVPQVRGLVFIDTDYNLVGAERGPDGVRGYTADYSGDEVVRQAIAVTETAEGAVWGAPAWRPRFELTILNLRQPVRRDGVYLGILVAVVSIAELSDYLAALSEILGDNAFILYDRDRVPASGRIASASPWRSRCRRIPAATGPTSTGSATSSSTENSPATASGRGRWAPTSATRMSTPPCSGCCGRRRRGSAP